MNRISDRALLFVMALLVIAMTGKQTQARTHKLAVAVLVPNAKDIQSLSTHFNQFERIHPNINVKLDFFSDASMKSKLSGWLESGEYDLIHWQAGKRLKNLVEQELIQPIETLLPKELLKRRFNPQVLEAVNINGAHQALPFFYYPWGFYYNKTLFARHGLVPPENWQAFLQLCKRLKTLGVSPLVQPTKDKWPLLAWVDYLTLDFGDNQAHKKMTNYGDLSRDDISQIAEKFGVLVNEGYFFAPDHDWSWQQAISVLLREQAAMTLLGRFAESEISPQNSDKFGYFAFPFSQPKKIQTSLTPVDVWVVPQASQKQDLTASLLEFISQPEVSEGMAIQLGYLPTNINANKDKLNKRGQIALEQINSKPHIVQYFDRESDPKYANNIANGIANSILKGEISSFKNALFGAEFIQPETRSTDLISSPNILQFSSTTGSRGTFFVSNVLQAVYKQLGFDISVTRYASLEQSKRSYQLGADGELVRAAKYAQFAPELIRVPEPISESSIFVVCHSSINCEQKLPAGTEVGMSSTLLIVDQWLANNQGTKKVYPSTSEMIRAHNENRAPLIVLPASDVYANAKWLKSSNYRTIFKLPFYHFIHKKHQDKLQAISEQLKVFKKTEEFQNMKTKYWLK